MANYTTSQDLINDALFRSNEPTDGTSDFDSVAVTYLNRAYHGIWSGGSELEPDVDEVWWWLRKDGQGTLTLNPVYDTGTVSVTNNSTTITFSANVATSQAGRHFKVDNHADVFLITAHTAATDTATLESVYTGDTDTAASYRNMQFDYTLASDLLYLTGPMYAYQDGEQEIPIIDLDEMKVAYPLNSASSGVPDQGAFTGEKKVRFSHYGGTSSTDLIKIDYQYIYEPADLADDSSEPLVPRQYRKILADWTAAYILEDKSDTKAAEMAALAQRGIISMAKEHRRRMARAAGSKNFGKIYPRQHQLARMRGPLRTESGLIVG